MRIQVAATIRLVMIVSCARVIIKLKPQALKGTYVKSVYLSSTMSPGICLDSKSIGAAE